MKYILQNSVLSKCFLFESLRAAFPVLWLLPFLPGVCCVKRPPFCCRRCLNCSPCGFFTPLPVIGPSVWPPPPCWTPPAPRQSPEQNSHHFMLFVQRVTLRKQSKNRVLINEAADVLPEIIFLSSFFVSAVTFSPTVAPPLLLRPVPLSSLTTFTTFSRTSIFTLLSPPSPAARPLTLSPAVSVCVSVCVFSDRGGHTWTWSKARRDASPDASPPQ